MPVYQDAIYRYKYSTHWMAILDLDEYLFPVEKNSLSDLLKEYEEYPALVANWVMFDSNGLQEHPQGKLITETYTRVHSQYHSPVNRHVKSIVNTKKVRLVHNPHYCFYHGNEYAVTENFELCKGPFTRYNSVNKIRINHYFSKSIKDYTEKIARGCADSAPKRNFNNSDINFPDTIQDFTIQKYLPALKEKMNCKDITLEDTPAQNLTGTNV